MEASLKMDVWWTRYKLVTLSRIKHRNYAPNTKLRQ